MRIDDGGSAVRLPPPPPPPPPPKQDTSQTDDVAAPKANTAQTPQQRVDAAVAKYDAAVKSGDQTAIAQAQTEVYAAVRDEIKPQVDQANAHIPAQYQPSSDSQVQSYGNVILRRHADDPTAQGVLKGAIGDYQVQRKADDLIPQFYGSFTPKEKLNSLASSLKGQSADVVQRVMQNRTVQQWMKDAASWVSEPYKGVSAQAAKENQQAALDASQRLADVTAGLPPDYVAQIVQQSMPTIQKVAGVDANYSGSSAFTNLSKVVGSLGDTPQAEELTKQIAQAYRGQFDTWEGRFDDPRGGIVKFAVGSGASPKLALELADQLQASGHKDQAGAILRSVESGAEDVQRQIASDMKEYGEQTKDLNWMIANSRGKLTDAQLQQAINKYIDGQPPEWRNKLQEIEEKIVADSEALNEDIGALNNAPDGLEQTAPDVFEALNKNIGENETTQTALKFAMSRDHTLFKSENASKAAAFWIEAAHKSKDFVNSVANAYITGRILPAVTDVNTTDPASIRRADQALTEFQRNASKFLGIPQSEVDEGVGKLKGLMHTVQTTADPKVAAASLEEINTANKELAELKDLHFTTGPAGFVFRTLALGISGGAVLNGMKESIENKDAQSIIGTFAVSVGLAQDTAGFAATVGALDKDSGLGKWGLAAGWVGEHTESFVGFLNVLSFAAGSAQSFSEGKPLIGTFDAVGAAGATLATFGEAMGLGSWAGPVGWGVTVLATAGVFLAENREELDHHTEIGENFLKGAGVDETAAKALSSDGMSEANKLQQQLNLSPDDLQKLAGTHPEVFNQGAGVTQSVMDVVKATGLAPGDVNGFIDAVAKDNPNYTQQFYAQYQNNDGMHPLTHQSNLVDTITHQYPGATSYLQQHAPDSVGPAADSRRAADRAYEMTDHSPMSVGNLLKGKNDPAYQSEIIRIMKQNGSLDTFVKSVGGSYAYNGWPQATQGAIRAAQGSGILTSDQAQSYLNQLPA